MFGNLTGNTKALTWFFVSLDLFQKGCGFCIVHLFGYLVSRNLALPNAQAPFVELGRIEHLGMRLKPAGKERESPLQLVHRGHLSTARLESVLQAHRHSSRLLVSQSILHSLPCSGFKR